MKIISLTTKKQITIPADFVEELGLQDVRKLRAEVINGKIIIGKEPEINEIFGPLWQKTRKLNKGSASDASIKASVESFYRTKPT